MQKIHITYQGFLDKTQSKDESYDEMYEYLLDMIGKGNLQKVPTDVICKSLDVDEEFMERYVEAIMEERNMENEVLDWEEIIYLDIADAQ